MAAHHKLFTVPAEDAIPLWGLTKFFRLGGLRCLDPYREIKNEWDLKNNGEDTHSTKAFLKR